MADAQVWSLSRLFNAIARRRRLFVWTTLTTLVAVVAFVMGLPDVYRASASLLVQGQLPEVVGQAAVPTSIDGRLQIIKQQALSRDRLTQLLTQFDLYGVSSGLMQVEPALERLQRDLQVDPATTDLGARLGSQTIAFRVSYVGNSAQTAADVTNALASYFVAQNDEMRSEQASRTAEFLGTQLAETRKRLEAQEGRVRAYSAKNAGALPQQLEANVAAINRLDAQSRINDSEYMRLIERRQTLKNELASAEAAVPPETDMSPQAQQARLERELTEARTRFGENYPDVKAAQAKLDAFKRNLAATGGRASVSTNSAPPAASKRTVLQQSLNETESQIERITNENAAINKQISTYQARVERAPAGAPAFDGLVRDYQATRDQFDALLKQYNAAQLTERAEKRSDTQEFRILDAALAPVSTAGPTRGILMGIGLLLALALGAGLVLVVDGTDTSFHSIDELRQFTAVPVLASIPVMTRPVGVVRRARDFAVTGAALLAIGVIAQAAFHVARGSDQVSRLLSRVM